MNSYLKIAIVIVAFVVGFFLGRKTIDVKEKIGDKVIFEGNIYTSKINSNTWSPTEYAQGWQKE